jgi:queuine tRNA-ribosyltransferase
MPFDGFAIGGLAVGETKSQREDFTELVAGLLPGDKPRYLMGVGTPLDLLEAIKLGVDMFDCIIPTKMAQQGNVYTSEGEVKLSQGVYKLSDDELDPDCECSTCTNFSRGYLHHLTKCRETLGWRALALHNIYYFHRLIKRARLAIAQDKFLSFYEETKKGWEICEVTPSEDFRDPPTFSLLKKKHSGQFLEK